MFRKYADIEEPCAVSRFRFPLRPAAASTFHCARRATRRRQATPREEKSASRSQMMASPFPSRSPLPPTPDPRTGKESRRRVKSESTHPIYARAESENARAIARGARPEPASAPRDRQTDRERERESERGREGGREGRRGVGRVTRSHGARCVKWSTIPPGNYMYPILRWPSRLYRRSNRRAAARCGSMHRARAMHRWHGVSVRRNR